MHCHLIFTLNLSITTEHNNLTNTYKKIIHGTSNQLEAVSWSGIVSVKRECINWTFTQGRGCIVITIQRTYT